MTFSFKKNSQNEFTKPIHIRYETQIPQIDDDHDDFYNIVMGTKSIDWAYEEEVRVTRQINQTLSFCDVDKDGKAIHLFDIPPSLFGAIYLGANSDAELGSVMRKELKDKNIDIPIFKGTILSDQFKLTWERVY
ncbi:hypothetical protein OE749_08820 [Aestuariibacter sp. AA17]|uniref:Uncharacterized protein n=1 Tax=Fluctibacter corallii TaxID=2984329 RepID=A0ABT3A944_9ALTE|nr:hypothetical protein [Aestuariibacter sp. AA17]MCV2884797.1 hypothetical protein [Aestuariibacter sp. AA17]